MREDSQLICPIAYDDPANIWNLIEKGLQGCNPLRDVTWKSQLSSSLITIAKLPIKFLPGTSSLFKDSDHPYRWFLAPYIHLYIVVAESMESYKSQRSTIKQWVSNIKQAQRSAWLLLFVPTAKQPIDVYQRVYATISSEFYKERAGDRTCMLNLSTLSSTPIEGISSIARRVAMSGDNNNLQDLCLKMSDSIVQSFKLRCVMYDTEIRRLDASRNTPNLEFRELFLVKESLALMYQMMQLPGEALVQYEEIEALLAFAPKTIKDIGGWPIFDSNDHFGNDNVGNKEVKTAAATEKDTVERAERCDSDESATGASSSWSWLCQEGEGVLQYSINAARMRILKNRIGLLELHRYVFARECYFLYGLGRPSSCVEKGNAFISFVRRTVSRRIDARKVSSDALPAAEDCHMKQIEKWRSLLDFWVVIASVKLVRCCTEFVLDGTIHNNDNEKTDHPSSGSLSKISVKIKECSPFIGELLQLATSRLLSLVSYNSKRHVDVIGGGDNHIDDESQQETSAVVNSTDDEELYRRPLQYFRRTAHAMVSKLTSWSEKDTLRSMYPDTFSVELSGSSALIDSDPAIDAFNRIIKDSTDVEIDNTKSDEKVNFFNISKELTQFSRYLTEMMMIDYLPSDSSGKKVSKSLGDADKCSSQSDVKSIEQDDISGDRMRREKRRRDYAAELISLLTLLLAEHEDLAGRQRFACQTKSQCADVLIVQGKFSMAQQLLLSALANICNSAHSIGGTDANNLTAMEILENPTILSTIWSGSTSTNSFGHITTAEYISKFAHQAGAANDDDCKEKRKAKFVDISGSTSYWKSLRYWILRKLLFCSCFIEANTTYVQVALSLLALDIGRSSSVPESYEWHSTLLSDVLNFARKKGANLSQSPVYHSLSPFIETSIMCISTNSESKDDNSRQDEEKNVNSALHERFLSSKLIESNQTIRDEIYKVHYANYECGRPKCVVLKLHSHFPIDLELNLQSTEPASEDALCLGYAQFYSSIVQGNAHCPSSLSPTAKELTTGHSFHDKLTYLNSWVDSSSSYGFHAYPVVLNTSNDQTSSHLEKLKTLKISPGEQLILMELHPQKPDDYCALYLSLKIGSLIFAEMILPPKPDEMPTYFDSHRLLSFSAPSDTLHFEAVAPLFTPMFFDDNFILSWSAENEDDIRSVIVAVKVDLLTMEPPLGASSSLGLDEPAYADHGFTLLIGELDRWKLKKYSTSSINKETRDEFTEIPHLVQDGLFRVENLNTSVTDSSIDSVPKYQLSIPFIVSNAKNFYSSGASLPLLKFEISCHVEYVLMRNGCLIENSSSISCTIQSGRAAEVTCHSDGLCISMDNNMNLSGDFFACCTFKNCSSLPLTLSAYETLPPILDDIPEETSGVFELCSVSGDALSSCGLPVLLKPLDEYHLTLRMVLKSIHTPTKDQNTVDIIKSLAYALIPRIGFAFSRFDVSAAQVFFNDMIFREDANIMLPVDSSSEIRAETTEDRPTIHMKHAYFSIRTSINSNETQQRVVSTPNGLLLDMNFQTTFIYQIWASVLLHPEHTVPLKLMVQLSPVDHWIPMGKTLMYLDPVSNADDAADETNNYFADSKNGIFSKWKFEFQCQFISIRYGETRPPPVYIRAVLDDPKKDEDKLCADHVGREYFVHIHTDAQLQPEEPILYIC